MNIHTAVVPAPPEPALGADWTLRPLHEPAPARSYAVTAAPGGPELLLRLHRVTHHPLRSCYPYGAHDLALGLVPPDDGPSGQALTAKLLCALVPALFAADPRCRRIVAAPDENDTATQAALEAGGLVRITEADLPDASVVLFAAEPPDLASMSTALDDMPH